jgi:hypothetical protein
MTGLWRIAIGVVVCFVAAGAFSHSFSRGQQAAVAMAMVVAHAAIGWWTSIRIRDHRGVERLAVAATIALGLSTLLPNLLGALGLLRAEIFLPLVALILVVAAFVTRASQPMSGGPQADHAAGKNELVTIVATTTLLFNFAARWMKAHVVAPLSWFGGDDISYHAAAVAVWNYTHDLRMLKFSSGDRSTPFYPIGSELEAWTLLAPFRDSDFFMRWSQLPFFVGCLIAIAALARRLNLSPFSAALAVLLFATIPRFYPELALSSGNDCSTAFYALAALHGTISLQRNARSAIYPGLAIGLLAGTKYVGFLFAVPLVLAAFIALLKTESDEKAPKRAAVATALALLGVALLAGGYTYARNAYVTGNPLFPAPVAIGDRVILYGWPESGHEPRMSKPEAHIDLVEFLVRRGDRLGWHFAFTIVPAALIAPVVALFRRRRRWEDVIVFVIPLIFFLEFLYLMGDHRDIRYVMPSVATAAVAYAWLLEGLPARGAFAARMATLLVLTLNLLRMLGPGVAGRMTLLIIASLIGLLAVWAAPRLTPRVWSVAVPLAVLFAIALPLSWTAAIQRYDNSKLAAIARHFPEARAAAAIDRITRNDGARIAYAGMNRPYLFFGSALQNIVDIVPTASPAGDRFYDWTTTAEIPYGHGGTFETWHRNLRELSTRFVVLVRERHDDAEPEYGWIQSHPQLFRGLISAGDAEVYEVLPEPP